MTLKAQTVEILNMLGVFCPVLGGYQWYLPEEKSILSKFMMYVFADMVDLPIYDSS